MALRGGGAGGIRFALPPGYDDTQDLSAFLWIRRASAGTAGARIFNLVNAARTRGFIIHLGGTVSGTNLATDVVVSVGAPRDNMWGAGDQDGRGRAILQGLSNTEFCALAFSVRGSAAPDNTGVTGAQQLHEVWWKGLPATVTSTYTGSGIPATGGYATLLCREAANLSAFDGWVAEVAVWQGHRLTAQEAARLSRGASPFSIAKDRLLFYRSWRSDMAAEVNDAPVTTLGAGASVDAGNHPALLIDDGGGRHAMGGTPPLLLTGEQPP